MFSANVIESCQEVPSTPFFIKNITDQTVPKQMKKSTDQMVPSSPFDRPVKNFKDRMVSSITHVYTANKESPLHSAKKNYSSSLNKEMHKLNSTNMASKINNINTKLFGESSCTEDKYFHDQRFVKNKNPSSNLDRWIILQTHNQSRSIIQQERVLKMVSGNKVIHTRAFVQQKRFMSI
ncbi:uncharacterized protein LOC111614493 isoform X2 [Centruroides sculpturatus]|uniref:uncharacterized protein LOC111614493 isoform X2 n=1 Tax=Centruroides sculpturatus TaxID=218467 RepID=UPI000C6EDC3F|nr:uncharacterized protein LOC111614493 isoform X2 [Centruroides sculpturatus]